LLRHVNDMLDLSKLDAGRMIAAYAEVDLAGMVRLAASYFESLAVERGIRYVVEATGSLTAQIDPSQIERSLLNLLSNAFKFTPAGGRVRVAVQATAGRAVVEVEDSGPGIPPPMREAIFERFRQLDGSTTRQFGGTGLGLSIARQFVNLHGGTLTVEDPPGGVGSLFRIALPLAAPEGAVVRRETEGPDAAPARQFLAELAASPLQEAQAHTPAARSGAPVVLLVEDNPDMNAFLSRTLAAEYRVVPAFDGQEGYDKAREIHPDLILCDIMMPRMSGEELVKELRGQREFDDVPIVLLTAKSDEALQVRLLQEGAQDYLQKPVLAEELMAKVARLIADRARVAEEMRAMHDLSDYLFQVGDQERKEVARELHENTAQCLAAVELNLAMVQDSVDALSPDTRRLLSDGIAQLQSCVGDIQCHVLHPVPVDAGSLRTQGGYRGIRDRLGPAQPDRSAHRDLARRGPPAGRHRSDPVPGNAGSAHQCTPSRRQPNRGRASLSGCRRGHAGSIRSGPRHGPRAGLQGHRVVGHARADASSRRAPGGRFRGRWHHGDRHPAARLGCLNRGLT
jgi:DNA-binding response OmpR family regulator/anti-sigma regulatory factor (Ser/Thr protein kinase)